VAGNARPEMLRRTFVSKLPFSFFMSLVQVYR